MKTKRVPGKQSSTASWEQLRLAGNRPVQFLTAPVPFTRHQAPDLGISLYRLRTDSRYLQLYRGVWIDTRPETSVPAPLWADHEWLLRQTHLQGLLQLDAEIAASNVTAARLYGLPLPSRIDEHSLHVVTSPNTAKARQGVVSHRYQELKTSNFFELPLISVPQLFLELAPLLTIEELTTLGDAAIGRWHAGPLTSISALRREVAARDRIYGRHTAEKALELMRGNVDSPRETWLRLWLISQGFPEPAVHPAIACPLVNAVLHPDLGYPNKKVAIEYEGDHHRSSDEQFATDNSRLAAMAAEGWTVLRVSKRTNMDQFARLLEHHLA